MISGNTCILVLFSSCPFRMSGNILNIVSLSNDERNSSSVVAPNRSRRFSNALFLPSIFPCSCKPQKFGYFSLYDPGILIFAFLSSSVIPFELLGVLSRRTHRLSTGCLKFDDTSAFPEASNFSLNVSVNVHVSTPYNIT